MPPAQSAPRRGPLALPRNVWLLGAASFFADISGEMLVAVLAFFIVSLGGGAAAVGFLGALGDAVAQIVKIPAGRWSDARGTRRPLVLAGYGVAALGKLALALAPTVVVADVGRAVDRTGKGIRTPPRDALIAESVEPDVRGRAFGVHRTLDSAGAVTGVAGALALLLLAVGLRTIALVSAALGVLALVPLLLVHEEARARVPSTRLSVALAALPRSLKRYLVAAALFGVANATILLFLLDAGPSLGATDAALGGALFYLVFTAANMLGAYPAGALSDRFGRKPIIAIGFAAFAVATLGFGLAHAPLVFAALFVALGLAIAMVDGNERALAADLAASGDRGSAIGALATVSGVAALVGGTGAGFLLATVGPLAAFGALAACATLAAIALLLV
ncbi:MAG: MFS transporter [Thermoplasmatota archaeon]